MGFLQQLWELIEYPLIGILDRSRLSRFFAVTFAVLGLLALLYGLAARDFLLVGSGIAACFAVLSVVTWKAGNWWAYKKALWKAQEGMPKHLKQRGFEVAVSESSDPDAR